MHKANTVRTRYLYICHIGIFSGMYIIFKSSYSSESVCMLQIATVAWAMATNQQIAQKYDCKCDFRSGTISSPLVKISHDLYAYMNLWTIIMPNSIHGFIIKLVQYQYMHFGQQTLFHKPSCCFISYIFEAVWLVICHYRWQLMILAYFWPSPMQRTVVR